MGWPDPCGNDFGCRPHEGSKNLLRRLLTEFCVSWSIYRDVLAQSIFYLNCPSGCGTFWSRGCDGLKENISHITDAWKLGSQLIILFDKVLEALASIAIHNTFYKSMYAFMFWDVDMCFWLSVLVTIFACCHDSSPWWKLISLLL